MSTPIQEVLPYVQLLGETGQLKTAREMYERILHEYTSPQDQAWIYYQFGALHWSETGDGTEARRLFELAIEKIESSAASDIAAIPYPLEAYACENLMLLSLLDDEYDRWSDRLERLQPTNPTLREQRPIVQLMRESGEPWSAVMLAIAHTYCDPEVGALQYSRAAAVFQLMLKNRKQLRLPRKIWGEVAGFYTAVIVRLVMACAQKSRAQTIDDFIFIAEEARPLVEEYLDANPMDQEAHATHQDLVQILENAAHMERRERVSIKKKKWWHFWKQASERKIG